MAGIKKQAYLILFIWYCLYLYFYADITSFIILTLGTLLFGLLTVVAYKQMRKENEEKKDIIGKES